MTFGKHFRKHTFIYIPDISPNHSRPSSTSILDELQLLPERGHCEPFKAVCSVYSGRKVSLTIWQYTVCFFPSINTQERLPYISYITYALEGAMLQAVGRSLLPNCEFCTYSAYSGGSQGLELRIPSLNCSTIMF